MEYIIEIDYNNTGFNDSFLGLSGGVLRYCTSTQLPLSEANSSEVSFDPTKEFQYTIESGILYTAGSVYKPANTQIGNYEYFSITTTNDTIGGVLAGAKGSPLAIGDVFRVQIYGNNELKTPYYKGNKFIVKNTLVADSIKTLSRAIDMKRGAGYNYTGSAEISFFLGETAEDLPPLNGADLRVYENNYCVFTGAISQNKLGVNGVMTITAEDSIRASGADSEILTTEIVPNDNYTGSPFFLPLVVGDVEVAKLMFVTSDKVEVTKRALLFKESVGGVDYGWSHCYGYDTVDNWGGTGDVPIANGNTCIYLYSNYDEVNKPKYVSGFTMLEFLEKCTSGSIVKFSGGMSHSFFVNKVTKTKSSLNNDCGLIIEGEWLQNGTISSDITANGKDYLPIATTAGQLQKYQRKDASSELQCLTGVVSSKASSEAVNVSNVANEDSTAIELKSNINGTVETLSGDNIDVNYKHIISNASTIQYLKVKQVINVRDLPPKENVVNYSYDATWYNGTPKGAMTTMTRIEPLDSQGLPRQFENASVELTFSIPLEQLKGKGDYNILLDMNNDFSVTVDQISVGDCEIFINGVYDGLGYNKIENVKRDKFYVADIRYDQDLHSIRRKIPYFWDGVYTGVSKKGFYDCDQIVDLWGGNPRNLFDSTHVFAIKEAYIEDARRTGATSLDILIWCPVGSIKSVLGNNRTSIVTTTINQLALCSVVTKSSYKDLYCTAKNTNNTPYTAVNHLLNKIQPYINKTNYLDATHGDWHTGRQITSQSSVVDIVSGLALQCCAKMMQERKGAIHVSYMQHDSANEWVFNEYNIVRNSVKPLQYTSVDGVYNKFNCKYHYDHRTQQYKYSVSVDKIDQPDFPVSTDPTWTTFVNGISDYTTAKKIWETCRQSYLDNGVIRQAPAELQELKWINKDSILGHTTSTIEKYLSYTSEWYAPRKAVISFRIPLIPTYGKIELGDKCTVTDFVATANQPRSGYITGIKRSPKNGVIDIDAIIFTVSSNTGNIVETGSATNQIIESGNAGNQIIEVGE